MEHFFFFFLKEREAAEEDGNVPESPKKDKIMTPFQEWETSLMSCTSYAQLMIHLTTLESSIVWSKYVTSQSILK